MTLFFPAPMISEMLWAFQAHNTFVLTFKVKSLLKNALDGADYTGAEFDYIKKSLTMRFFNIGTQNTLRHSVDAKSMMLRDGMKGAVIAGVSQKKVRNRIKSTINNENILKKKHLFSLV